MTEQMKARAGIKKDFQKVISTIREQGKMKEFPKAGASKDDMKKAEMEITVHCGFGEARSTRIVELVRHHKMFLDWMKDKNAKAAYETIRTPEATKAIRGENLTKRIQIRVTLPDDGAFLKGEAEEEPGEADGSALREAT